MHFPTEFFNDLLSHPGITKALWPAVVETLQMTGITAAMTILIGLPLGVLLNNLSPRGLTPNGPIYSVLAVIVNITRSIPFAILLMALLPVAKFLTNKTLGPVAASVSLSVAAIPFFARIVESALREVDPGKIDAALVMGSSNGQTVRKVIIPEAMPSLISGFTTTIVAVIGYTAMAGLVGGGGLGRLAYNYGFQRYETTIMIVTIVIIVLLVQLIQMIGDRLTKAVSHR
ncbi:methionine ABC transporter permease [Micrococcoides hystricis]|uniref:Methionine ABC transporter permease n=1 Tax=Micrococcoides hystricis TaxID=1572761 RepID=A0ABV6P9T9_9MICC